MGSESAETLTYLERLDLALAGRIVPRAEQLDASSPLEDWANLMVDPTPRLRPHAGLVSGHLELRGLDLRIADVYAVLHGRSESIRKDQQEYTFIHGMARCLALVQERGRTGNPPDGEFAVTLFRTFAGDLARFRNNWLRRDMPWDGLIYVPYPDAADVPMLLGDFNALQAYRDQPLRFASLHPVRQAFRVLWRLARIAPFPDFNVLMAFLAMNTFLVAKGYPALTPMPGDREVLNKLLSGPPPTRMPMFEARLAELA